MSKRLRDNIRRKHRYILKAIKNNRKKCRSVSDLGCPSLDFFKKYLEELFYKHPVTGEQMTWDNHGHKGWHLDHKVPLAAFNLKTKRDLKQVEHYTNLQPLWAEENWKKGA
jgi:hypothetical protein